MVDAITTSLQVKLDYSSGISCILEIRAAADRFAFENCAFDAFRMHSTRVPKF